MRKNVNVKAVGDAAKNVNNLMEKGSNAEILDALKKLNKLLGK